MGIRCSRRALLCTGSLGAAAALGGCSALGLEGGTDLTLSLQNFDDATHRVSVRLSRTDGEEKQDRLFTYAAEYDLPPADGEQPGARRDVDVVRSRSYVVRARARQVNGPQVAGSYQFQPSCTGGGEYQEVLRITVHPDDGSQGLRLAFDQNRCGDDVSLPGRGG